MSRKFWTSYILITTTILLLLTALIYWGYEHVPEEHDNKYFESFSPRGPEDQAYYEQKEKQGGEEICLRKLGRICTSESRLEEAEALSGLELRKMRLQRLHHPEAWWKPLRPWEDTLRRMKAEGKGYDSAWNKAELHLAKPAAEAFEAANEAVWADSGEAMTIELRASGAWRSMDHQERLFSAANGDTSLAGKPGHSLSHFGIVVMPLHPDQKVADNRTVADYLTEVGFVRYDQDCGRSCPNRFVYMPTSWLEKTLASWQ